MSDEIELISDGDGLAVIGNPTVVDRFLVSQGLSSKELGLQRLRPTLGATADAVHVGSEIAANSGRWVKLTEDSAKQIEAFGLMKGSASDLSRGVVQAKNGQIKGIVEFTKGPGSALANPALLAGAAGLMAQLAMQQAMDEITEYLAAIDEKVDDVLRAQKDAVIADMIGVGFALEEAMTLREQVGRVSEVTWSKVQATATTVGRTQAYALRQLDALAEKLEKKTNVGDLAKASKHAESKVLEWLAILARCVQLQDAFTVLELDRVFDAASDELDRHRIALKDARQRRLELIARSVESLMDRLDAAAERANTKVLFNPVTSPIVVRASNHVSAAVTDFESRLGIQGGRQSLKVRRWVDAASELKDDVLERGAEGVSAATRLGSDARDQAKSIAGKLTSGIAEQVRRRRGDGDQD